MGLSTIIYLLMQQTQLIEQGINIGKSAVAPSPDAAKSEKVAVG